MEILLVLVVVVIENPGIEDEDEKEREDDWKKIANPPRPWAEAIRVTRFIFIFLCSLAGLR